MLGAPSEVVDCVNFTQSTTSDVKYWWEVVSEVLFGLADHPYLCFCCCTFCCLELENIVTLSL